MTEHEYTHELLLNTQLCLLAIDILQIIAQKSWSRIKIQKKNEDMCCKIISPDVTSHLSTQTRSLCWMLVDLISLSHTHTHWWAEHQWCAWLLNRSFLHSLLTIQLNLLLYLPELKLLLSQQNCLEGCLIKRSNSSHSEKLGEKNTLAMLVFVLRDQNV